MKKKFPLLLYLLLLSGCSYKVHQYQNVYQLSKSGTNFYLIKENNQYLMVDCGKPNQGEKIEKVLLKNKIDPSRIKYLILTHAHYDHAGNAHYFKEKFNTKIIVGKEDFDMIQAHGKDSLLCPTNFIAHLGKPFIKNIEYPLFSPDILIDDFFDLNSISFSGTIFPLPGHTKGSLVLKNKTSVFVGDLIRGNLLNSAKPKRHFYMCDLINNKSAIKDVVNLPNITTWYLGHGGPIDKTKILEFLDKDN